MSLFVCVHTRLSVAVSVRLRETLSCPAMNDVCDLERFILSTPAPHHYHVYV